MLRLSVVALALCALATAKKVRARPERVAADDSVVNTPLGPVQGVSYANYRLFQGVPYAKPPVGPRRWMPPEAVEPWSGTWNATAEAPGCPQLCTNDEPPHICPVVISEDCLYLNVWAPRAANITGPVPVILFIHGGNFHDGYTGGTDLNGGLLYDGSTFVQDTGAIMVVMNYRLGNWGFLYLGADSPIKGNLGLMDQELAMTWIRQNIAAFGGDSTRLTVMGQSAGAMSISAHMSRPQTQGLYSGAIMHSNPFAEPYRTVDEALSLASVFANFTGCSLEANGFDWTRVEGCLRTKPVDVLLAAQIASETDVLADLDKILQIVVVWSPTTGTPYLPQRPLEAFQAGNAVDIPYMVGTTANETVIFVYEALDTALTADEFELLALVLLGNAEAYEQSSTYYPRPSPPLDDYRVFASTLLTDGLFLCPTRNATEALQAAQPYRRSSMWHWQYSHMLNWADAAWGSNFTECATYVCHGSDLPGWWHPTLSPGPGYGNYTAAETSMATTLHQMWARFAATGEPAPANVWPPYTAETRLTLNIETSDKGGFTVIPNLRDITCNWWDTVVGYNVY